MKQDEIIEMVRIAEDKVIANPNLDWKIEFAKLVAAKEREYYEGILVQICMQCRGNEWGPLTHKKEILSWFHDFAANALERGGHDE